MDYNNIVSCKNYAETRKKELKKFVDTLVIKPTLVVFQVDSNIASSTYVKGKQRDCEEMGLIFRHIIIDSNVYRQDEFEDLLKKVNGEISVNGIIIQLPIPDKYNLERLQNCINPEKDVDGFRRDSQFEPCTPKGIVDWLTYNNYDLEGKNITVVGRSNIVGKPLVNMLIDKGATVTCCNSKTRNLCEHTFEADIVVSAIGKPKYFDFSYFLDTEIIIDVGINRTEDGKLCGDIDNTYFEKYLTNTYVTPVPCGVGLLTRMALIENVVQAYQIQNKKGEK